MPRQQVGVINPLIAGGLRATMDEYAVILGFEYNRGVFQGNRLISASLFDVQATEPYPAAATGNSPFTSAGLDFHYGLTSWLECAPPAVNCAVQSSPGAFGFTPWVHRTDGYYAVIGMEVPLASADSVALQLRLEQDLKPLIRTALSN